MTTPVDPLSGQLLRALDGDPGAVRALVSALTPVIEARASRALARRGAAQGRDSRQELADMVQDVFLSLFEEDGKVLRGWSEDRGLSLLNFVGLVTERRVCSTLRSGRRSPWAIDPSEESDLERAMPQVSASEDSAGARDLFVRVCERLEEELSPAAMVLFRLIVIEERPTEEVAASMKLSTAAIYMWRMRLLKRARALLVELDGPSSAKERAASRRTPERSADP